jgi:hypothetical protein
MDTRHLVATSKSPYIIGSFKKNAWQKKFCGKGYDLYHCLSRSQVMGPPDKKGGWE